MMKMRYPTLSQNMAI